MLNICKHIKDLTGSHELLFAIAGRSVRVKYKQSFLGIAWAVVQPLAQVVVFTLVFSVFAKIPSEGIPYPIFAYTALLPWSFFSTGISSAASSIVGNASLVTKVRLPTEIFPFGAILARSVDLGISSAILLGMMLLYRVPLNVHMMLLIPLLLIQLLLMMALSLFLSAIDVFYRDINFAIGMVMQMWMFTSPVAYPISIVPDRYRGLYMLNPMASIMDGYRKVILHATGPDWGALAWVALVSAVMLILSYWFFKVQEGKFADMV
jgi:lipopolysaccharide transport system permease protein